MDDHLTRAREYIAIAESSDAKREAYKRAAEHIAAHRAETGDSHESVARYCNTSRERVSKLLQWRDTGYAAATPFLMDERATGRAARSHTKKWLREAEPEDIEQMVSELPSEQRAVIAQAAVETPPVPPTIPPVDGTAAEYLRAPAPDPSEYEIDHLALDLARRARELRDRIRRYGVRTMNQPGDTLRDLDSMIADATEARAAVQEYINEEALK